MDGSEVDLRIETRESAIGWDPSLAAPAVVDGVVFAIPLALDNEDNASAAIATQQELFTRTRRSHFLLRRCRT